MALSCFGACHGCGARLRYIAPDLVVGEPPELLCEACEKEKSKRMEQTQQNREERKQVALQVLLVILAGDVLPKDPIGMAFSFADEFLIRVEK